MRGRVNKITGISALVLVTVSYTHLSSMPVMAIEL